MLTILLFVSICEADEVVDQQEDQDCGRQDNEGKKEIGRDDRRRHCDPSRSCQLPSKDASGRVQKSG